MTNPPFPQVELFQGAHLGKLWCVEKGGTYWTSFISRVSTFLCPLGQQPPKIHFRYYQECLLFNVQWCFCSAVTCTPVQKGVPEQIQQKCSQYFSLYLIGISLISGSSKGPTLVAVFTKLLKICAYSLKYRFALVLMFFLQKNCQIQGKPMPNFRFVQET